MDESIEDRRGDRWRWIDGPSSYRARRNDQGEMEGMGQLDPRFIATDPAGSAGCPPLPPPSPHPSYDR